jgi:protein-S-isoprenylcysteine O-methyltransferase Ste14
MNEFIIFLGATAVFVWISWFSLLNPRSHGFYRFFAWECALALVLLNFPVWTKNPSSFQQLVSWVLLAASILLALHAVHLLRSLGKPSQHRHEPELLAFEKTSSLVTTGAYRYIRHPMYAALLLLAWGTFLKDISVASSMLVGETSVALFFTALREEEECKRHFGAAYVEYLKTSKRFVPFVF